MTWDPNAPYPTQAYSASQHTLDFQKVGMTQHLPSGLHRAKFEVEPGWYADEMVARLTAYVLSEHLAADTVEESTLIPQSWWDHLKHDLQLWANRKPCRLLTRWWLQRHPSKDHKLTLTATWTRRATRPESKIRFAEDRLGAVVYQEEVSHHLYDPRYQS